jgi:hypothetical protein
MDEKKIRGTPIYGSPHIFDGNHPWELIGYNLNLTYGEWPLRVETIIVDRSEWLALLIASSSVVIVLASVIEPTILQGHAGWPPLNREYDGIWWNTGYEHKAAHISPVSNIINQQNVNVFVQKWSSTKHGWDGAADGLPITWGKPSDMVTWPWRANASKRFP